MPEVHQFLLVIIPLHHQDVGLWLGGQCLATLSVHVITGKSNISKVRLKVLRAIVQYMLSPGQGA